MKKIILAIVMAIALSGCASKNIDRTSPCACYDLIVKRG